jgi:hypothetical protein
MNMPVNVCVASTNREKSIWPPGTVVGSSVTGAGVGVDAAQAARIIAIAAKSKVIRNNLLNMVSPLISRISSGLE